MSMRLAVGAEGKWEGKCAPGNGVFDSVARDPFRLQNRCSDQLSYGGVTKSIAGVAYCAILPAHRGAAIRRSELLLSLQLSTATLSGG